MKSADYVISRDLRGRLANSPGFGGYSMSLPGGKPLARLRERWLAFLEARGKEMEAGTRFRAGDGVVTRDLFPERFQYSLGSNRMGWPGEADEKR